MNPVTHALVGWSLSETYPAFTNRERALVVAAGVAPDLDGFGLLPELLTRDGAHPLFWWTDYHHVLCHNLMFAVAATLLASGMARVHRLRSAVLVFVSVHLHLLGDLIGSRGPEGYQWPVPYLYPFRSDIEMTWSGQWALNAWPNITITLGLLAVTFVLAWRRGYSPVGLFSSRADRAFVTALRARVPRV